MVVVRAGRCEVVGKRRPLEQVAAVKGRIQHALDDMMGHIVIVAELDADRSCAIQRNREGVRAEGGRGLIHGAMNHDDLSTGGIRKVASPATTAPVTSRTTTCQARQPHEGQ